MVTDLKGLCARSVVAISCIESGYMADLLRYSFHRFCFLVRYVSVIIEPCPENCHSPYTIRPNTLDYGRFLRYNTYAHTLL